MYYVHQGSGDPYVSPLLGPAWLRRLVGDDFFREVAMLNLNAEKLTSDQWQQLEKLTTTRELYMCDARGSDEDLIHLKDFNAIVELHVIRTQITDKGLAELGKLTTLRELSIWDTGVTEAGVAKLQQALPNCKITH